MMTPAKEYGLADPKDHLQVSIRGKNLQTFFRRPNPWKQSDRYALDPTTGRVYVIAGPSIQPLFFR